MNSIGILQERLGLSLNAEFAVAQEIGFTCVELLVREGDVNRHPIWSDKGIKHLKVLSSRYQVGIPSVCADHFKLGELNSPDRDTRRRGVDVLCHLVEQSAQLGIERILIPFFDAAEIKSERDKAFVIESLMECLPQAQRYGLHLSLETMLPAKETLELVHRFDHPSLKVYYDIGNAAALGFDIRDELQQLGPWISGVHLKDRKYLGSNVPMGTGDVDFVVGFQALRAIPYQGPFILETTMGDNPLEYARRHLAFVRRMMALAKGGQNLSDLPSA